MYTNYTCRAKAPAPIQDHFTYHLVWDHTEQRGSPFFSRVFGSAQPKRRILRGCQLNTPCCTTTAFSGGTSFLPPPGGGPLKQNRGKIGCSIQAVLKILSVPGRFWERGPRCFVRRLCVRRLDEAATFFRGWVAWASTCRRGTCKSFTLCV